MVELQRIKLKGFKSIREMDLELRDLNVLIGANGSGKSNFVSIFTLLSQIARQNLQFHVGVSGGADLLLHFGQKHTSEMSCQVDCEDVRYLFDLAPTERGAMVFAQEECYSPGYPPESRARQQLLGGSGHVESLLAETARGKSGGFLKQVIDRFRNWRVYHFHDTSESAKVKQTCDVHDNRFLRPDGANLASILYLLKERYEQHYRNIVDAVCMVAPFFDDFDLRPSELNELKIRLAWHEKGWDWYFGPESQSDGTLRFICLATLLLQPKPPSLIIIDEPELGLHPHAIGVVAAMLKSASVKSQVIVCTQSVTLVNQLEPADIGVLEREDGPTTFRRLSDEDMSGWLDEYGLGDLWEKNILGGSP